MSCVHQLSQESREGCTQSPGEGAQLSPDRRQLPATQPPSGTSASFCLQLLMFPGLRCGTTMGRMLQPCPRAIQQMRKEHHHNCAVELHKVAYEAFLALAWKALLLWLWDNYAAKHPIVACWKKCLSISAMFVTTSARHNSTQSLLMIHFHELYIYFKCSAVTSEAVVMKT